MPCYEWQCKSCRELFEITCPAADREASQDCPHCGSRRTQRVYTGVTHRWRDVALEATGITPAEMRSVTERAKKEFGVKQP